jgi:DNA polymerase III psi subunit
MINTSYLQELELVPYILRKCIGKNNLGNNLDSDQIVTDCLIIVDQNYADSAEYQELFTKLLSSIKSINDNLQYKVVVFKNLVIEHYKFNKIISFGVKLEANINLEQNNILLAPAITDLVTDINLKKQLWQNLQRFCKSDA